MTDLPPILFLHGLATTSARTWGDNGWFDLVREAERDFLPIDLPGHGVEYKTTSDFDGNLANYVSRAIPFPVVDGVGFSLGARVLLEIACTNPNQFRKLVLAGVGDSLFEPDLKRGARISDALSGAEDFEDPESRYFHQLAEHSDIDGTYIARYLKNQESMMNPDSLARINIPILVVLGENDFAGPATKLVNILQNATLVTLKGVDHFATPKDFHFLESALEFLDAVPEW